MRDDGDEDIESGSRRTIGREEGSPVGTVLSNAAHVAARSVNSAAEQVSGFGRRILGWRRVNPQDDVDRTR